MTETADFMALRTCLLSPLPEHDSAADMLSEAADAILAGDLDLARNLVRRADMPVLLAHTNLVMSDTDPAIQRKRPIAISAGKLPRVASRMPSPEATKALFARDGWRCRFCDCRVIPPKVRTAMRSVLPGAIPWSEPDPFHGAFVAMSASVDHVLPHSAGGTNEERNLVTACWSCQFGRGWYTLEKVGLIDPRARPPVKDGWDGLERLLTRTVLAPISLPTVPAPTVPSIRKVRDVPPPSPQRPRLSHAEWFASLDATHPMASSRLIAFVDGCSHLDVSWSLNEVLIVRMTFGGATLAILGVQQNGLVAIPWMISGRKDAFRSFAETLAPAIPGATVYETPKLWNVSKADKQQINVLELLDEAVVLRLALEKFRSELHGGR